MHPAVLTFRKIAGFHFKSQFYIQLIGLEICSKRRKRNINAGKKMNVTCGPLSTYFTTAERLSEYARLLLKCNIRD